MSRLAAERSEAKVLQDDYWHEVLIERDGKTFRRKERRIVGVLGTVTHTVHWHYLHKRSQYVKCPLPWIEGLEASYAPIRTQHIPQVA